MRTYLSIVVVFLIILFITGCKQEVSSTLFIGDVLEVVSGKSKLSSLGNVKFEMPTEKTCQEKMEKFSRVIAPFFNNINKSQCITEGMDTFFYANFDLPVVLAIGNGQFSDNYKGGVALQLYQKDNIYSIYISMKTTLLSALDNDLRQEFMGGGGVDAKEMTVDIAINNDTRDSYILSSEGVFLDGNAISPLFYQRTKLGRRSESVISLSNVAISALLGTGNVPFAYVGKIIRINPETTTSN